jgi:hypothetical protein
MEGGVVLGIVIGVGVAVALITALLLTVFGVSIPLISTAT